MASAHGVCPRCGLPPPAPVVSGPRDEETWRKVGLEVDRPGPGWGYYAIVAFASLTLGAVLSAWALGLL